MGEREEKFTRLNAKKRNAKMSPRHGKKVRPLDVNIRLHVYKHALIKHEMTLFGAAAADQAF